MFSTLTFNVTKFIYGSNNNVQQSDTEKTVIKINDSLDFTIINKKCRDEIKTFVNPLCIEEYEGNDKKYSIDDFKAAFCPKVMPDSYCDLGTKCNPNSIFEYVKAHHDGPKRSKMSGEKFQEKLDNYDKELQKYSSLTFNKVNFDGFEFDIDGILLELNSDENIDNLITKYAKDVELIFKTIRKKCFDELTIKAQFRLRNREYHECKKTCKKVNLLIPYWSSSINALITALENVEKARSANFDSFEVPKKSTTKKVSFNETAKVYDVPKRGRDEYEHLIKSEYHDSKMLRKTEKLRKLQLTM